ncbi:MAG: hypothetical protein A49_09010 [Methyloceanibacter sp.]|nr:MAG: hypothetical protein A49_09010 [Methyloceanibacter sp.]
MASNRPSLTDEFQQIMQHLLLDQVEDAGALVLFVRRTLGKGTVYFPISYALGQELDIPHPILPHYYLYSLQYDNPADHDTLILDGTDGIAPLIRAGKLAIAFFPNGPVAMRFYACDTDSRSVLLCSLTHHAPGSASAWTPSASFRIACSKLVAQWQDLAQTSISFDQGDHVAVADTLAQLLSDQQAQPPYFPTMHVRVDSREKANSDLQVGRWRTNCLSYNCFLMDGQERLAEEYIHQMFLRGDRAYIDSTIQSTKPLVNAIVSACDDFVHLIGEDSERRTRVYARRNIAKGSYQGNPAFDPIVARSYRSFDSAWRLLRHALHYLQDHEAHKNTALITIWAGVVDQDNGITAFPLGFVPGGRPELLEKAVGYPALSPQIVKGLNSPHDSLELTAVLTGSTEQAGAGQDELCTRLSRILEEAERAIPGAVWEPVYMGPYQLVLDEAHIDIIQKKTGKPVATIDCLTTPGEKTFYLLRALAESGPSVHVVMACSPEVDPVGMRVQPPREGAGRILDEAEETQSGAGGSQASGG